MNGIGWFRRIRLTACLLCACTASYGQSIPSEVTFPAGSELETIVVTANKRQENLQDAPIAVSVISGSALATSGVNTLTDLPNVVPGLNVQEDDGFLTTHLRGVGSSIIGPGLENPIALYVDGVYYASTASANLDFVSVADVEVLKGPQGTLFGRNATGGLIQVTTRTPTQDFRADVELTYGDYQTSKIDGYVAGGVTSNLTADFAIQLKRQGEGFGRNVATGQDVYQDDFDGTARSKWVYTVSELTRLTGILDFAQSRNSDNVFNLNPGTTASPASATYRFNNPWDTDLNTQPRVANTGGGASLRLDQDLGFARLMDVVAFRRSSTRLDFDIDSTPLAEEAGFLSENDRQFSEELQLQSSEASAVKWVAGLFYFDADGKYVPPSMVDLGTTQAVDLQGDEKTLSVAGFSQATIEIFPQTHLTAGIRYTYENRKLLANQELAIVDGPLIPISAADASKDFDRATYRLSVDHRFSDEILGYVSFNTGFKSGGFNTQVPTDPAFQPETIKSYEIGFKNDLLDKRLRVDVAAFYYDYTNIQVEHLELISSGVINGPPAQIYGTDVDLLAQVTSAFRLGASFEYLHARFVGSSPQLPVGTYLGGVPLTSGSVDGNQLPVSPAAVATLTADYSFSAFAGQVNANATYEHSSGWYSEPDNIISQPAFNRLNLSMRWTSQDERYHATLWGNNVTNAAVIAAGTTQITGVQSVQLEPPRTYGVTVGYHF